MAVLPLIVAASPAPQAQGSGVVLPVNPASPSTVGRNVYTPPPPPDGNRQLCLFDKPTRQMICHTVDEWRAQGISRSAKENFEAKTIK
ncbi:hypothetical protein EAH79_05540 [Sphingomonas koreensis]|nr:hypothetical protein EAH79_05540 [Sphingomonas koreensis]